MDFEGVEIEVMPPFLIMHRNGAEVRYRAAKARSVMDTFDWQRATGWWRGPFTFASCRKPSPLEGPLANHCGHSANVGFRPVGDTSGSCGFIHVKATGVLPPLEQSIAVSQNAIAQGKSADDAV
jgi:hypothetical protein